MSYFTLMVLFYIAVVPLPETYREGTTREREAESISGPDGAGTRAHRRRSPEVFRVSPGSARSERPRIQAESVMHVNHEVHCPQVGNDATDAPTSRSHGLDASRHLLKSKQ